MIIHVTPTGKYVVRHPVSFQRIGPEGANVEASAYWTRRKEEGAITITPATPAPAPQIDTSTVVSQLKTIIEEIK